MGSKDTRPISWIKAARKTFAGFPQGARMGILRALTIAAEGRKADIAKPLKGFGSGVFEVALRHHSDAYRTVYAVQLDDDVWVAARLPEEGETGHEDTEEGPRFDPRAAQTTEEGAKTMTDSGGDFELVRGGGNVFRDFGHPAADVEQTKTMLAAEIIGILDDEGLSTRKAQERTGINHADFARIRNAKLDRFTIDRLMTIVDRLGRRVEVRISVQPRGPGREEIAVHP